MFKETYVEFFFSVVSLSGLGIRVLVTSKSERQGPKCFYVEGRGFKDSVHFFMWAPGVNSDHLVYVTHTFPTEPLASLELLPFCALPILVSLSGILMMPL